MEGRGKNTKNQQQLMHKVQAGKLTKVNPGKVVKLTTHSVKPCTWAMCELLGWTEQGNHPSSILPSGMVAEERHCYTPGQPMLKTDAETQQALQMLSSPDDFTVTCGHNTKRSSLSAVLPLSTIIF